MTLALRSLVSLRRHMVSATCSGRVPVADKEEISVAEAKALHSTPSAVYIIPVTQR